MLVSAHILSSRQNAKSGDGFDGTDYGGDTDGGGGRRYVNCIFCPMMKSMSLSIEIITNSTLWSILSYNRGIERFENG
jgi:hypothetical protein